ncbi:CD209 antigen [Labeo rohita]|uniref:CD209 antigen n=1 Tax=Labeo rohita TaxID=84645 RepID=UPI0021E337A1|nr:CD209 antigen [Labeo rohita]
MEIKIKSAHYHKKSSHHSKDYSSSVKMYDKIQEQIMDLEVIHDSDGDTTGFRTTSYRQDKGKDQQCRGSRCLALITVSLGLICVLLLVFIILQHITITAERDMRKSYKNTVEEFNQTINSLQNNYTDLMNEKHQLQNNFSSLSQKKLELETKAKDLNDAKDILQRSFDSLNKKKLELESKVTYLDEELKKESTKRGWFFLSNEEKSWSDSRQYCRDRGGDLVIIKSEEKQRFISSLTMEKVWIGLSDTVHEGKMTWVDDSPLNQGFWLKGEPNSYGGNEDCIELNYKREQPGWSPLNSWNDQSCSEKRKGICEKSLK